jgi:hypothetical protein
MNEHGHARISSDTNIENRAASHASTEINAGWPKVRTPVAQQPSNPTLNGYALVVATSKSCPTLGLVLAKRRFLPLRVTGLKFKKTTAFTPSNHLGGCSSQEIALSTPP